MRENKTKSILETYPIYYNQNTTLTYMINNIYTIEDKNLGIVGFLDADESKIYASVSANMKFIDNMCMDFDIKDCQILNFDLDEECQQFGTIRTIEEICD